MAQLTTNVDWWSVTMNCLFVLFRVKGVRLTRLDSVQSTSVNTLRIPLLVCVISFFLPAGFLLKHSE